MRFKCPYYMHSVLFPSPRFLFPFSVVIICSHILVVCILFGVCVWVCFHHRHSLDIIFPAFSYIKFHSPRLVCRCCYSRLPRWNILCRTMWSPGILSHFPFQLKPTSLAASYVNSWTPLPLWNCSDNSATLSFLGYPQILTSVEKRGYQEAGSTFVFIYFPFIINKDNFTAFFARVFHRKWHQFIVTKQFREYLWNLYSIHKILLRHTYVQIVFVP